MRPFPARLFVVPCLGIGLGLSLFGTCIAQSSAGTQSAVYDAPHFSVDPEALYAAASQVSAPEGTNAIVLTDEEDYVFDDQGRAVHTQYVIFKVLTRAGVEDWAHISVPWAPWREERPGIRARVISADGEVHVLDSKTISDAPAQEADDTYSDSRVTRAPFPAVAIGSVVEEEEVTVETAALPAGGIVARDYFGRTVPVQRTRLVLDAPSSLTLRYPGDSGSRGLGRLGRSPSAPGLAARGSASHRG